MIIISNCFQTYAMTLCEHYKTFQYIMTLFNSSIADLCDDLRSENF